MYTNVTAMSWTVPSLRISPASVSGGENSIPVNIQHLSTLLWLAVNSYHKLVLSFPLYLLYFAICKVSSTFTSVVFSIVMQAVSQ